jgi:hypothetical protein
MAMPTELDYDLRCAASELINEYGRDLLIVRPVRSEVLTGSGIGGVTVSPLSTSSVVIDGNYIEGTSTIGIRSAPLTGLLVNGDTFVIAGENYIVSGGPYIVSGNAIDGITISPPLIVDADDGNTVTVLFTGSQYSIKGGVEIFSLALVNSQDSSIQSGDFKVTFAQLDLDKLGIVPTTKDQLYNGPDTTYPLAAIISVDSLPSGELDAAIIVHARMSK